MAVYDQHPSTINTVARGTNFACRLFYYLYRKNKVEFADRNNSYIVPMAQLAGDDQDEFGNLYDRIALCIPMSPDSTAGANSPWTYATIPDYTDTGALTDFFDGTLQTTFNIPSTVNTVPKAASFWVRLFKQMYGSRKIYIPDALGSRQWPLVRSENGRTDVNGALYDVFDLYLPKVEGSVAGNSRPWANATTPAIVQTPPGYFAT